MADDRWQRVKDVFGAALELPPASREAYLRDTCRDDDALRREVEQLLTAQSAAGAFLSRSPGLAEAGRPPALAPGRSLGTYEIAAPIGAGGMGEVYRARDRHLGREVAIKVLPDLFVKDADRLARFAREARLLASLNHPNIAAVHGFEEADGTRFLVMELVPGETLAERLREGPLPIKDALAVAQQLAEALEEAHAKGIVHRDLKPANVKVTDAGKVKVLDFGLAKALSPETQPSNPAESPTLTRTGGMLLGTAAYMSPEQARGKPVDKRTDVWAFGCVLYEMLSGRAPFDGETVSDVIANVLKHDPDWTLLRADTPAGVRRLLHRCMQKDPHRRLHDIADARIELEETLSDASLPSGPRQPSASNKTHQRLAWGLAALSIVVAAAAVWRAPRDTGPAQPVSFLVNPPENGAFAPTGDSSFPQFAISPDGRRLVFVASGPDRRRMLWVRRLDSVTPVPLPGTEGAFYPFWSPDARQIGFFAGTKLKRVELAGGVPHTLADVPTDASAGPRGGTWNSDDVILYSPSYRSGLFRVNAQGGSPSPVAELDGRVSDASFRWPQFLPDGRHFVFMRRAARPHQGIYVGSLDSKTLTQLSEDISSAAFAPPSHLLFARGGALMAVSLDRSRWTFSGKPFPVVERVGYAPSINFAAFSVSPTGVLVHVGGGASTSRLQWFDRKGQLLETVGEPGDYLHPRLSPDEKQVAVARLDPQTSGYDLWLLDRPRRSASRFTFGPNSERFPLWSSDGKKIAFASQTRQTLAELAWQETSGAAPEQVFPGQEATAAAKLPHDWSRDGRFIVYHTQGRSDWDLYLYDALERKDVPFLAEQANEVQGQFSRDGRWMAYTSDESGRYEVYVQPFPKTGSKWQISTGGGSQPRWRADGKEIFYLAPDGKLMAAALEAATSLKAGVPQPLFATQMAALDAQYDNNYAVTADGQGFLVNTLVASGVSPLTVVLNWSAAQPRE